MDVRELIKQLGGPSTVAGRLGLGITAVSNWSLRNEIPRTHHLAVWMLTRSSGVTWTPPGAEEYALVPRDHGAQPKHTTGKAA